MDQEVGEGARQFLYREGLNSSDFLLVKVTANDFYFRHKETGKIWEFRRQND